MFFEIKRTELVSFLARVKTKENYLFMEEYLNSSIKKQVLSEQYFRGRPQNNIKTSRIFFNLIIIPSFLSSGSYLIIKSLTGEGLFEPYHTSLGHKN
jgi:hypothetical protein